MPEERSADPTKAPDAGHVSRETIGVERTTKEFFGAAYPAVDAFAVLLEHEGELRGLIGPREVGRIWSRHILNSAAVVPFLPEAGLIVDVGSGAGLPGIVVAAMRPSARVVLIEPMERRCAWLNEVIERVSLPNVEVYRGRAEEFHGALVADAVTARAVAPLDRLARWTLPLLRRGGELLALKGKNVDAELPAARRVLPRLGGSDPEVLAGATVPGAGDTVVVRVVRRTAGHASR
jgi:16S rRNA (guanine527-N7)-methyltransferase